MKQNSKQLAAALILVTACSGSALAKKFKEEVSLTIYNDNFAVVRDLRPMDFTQGINTMRFTDVASQIDPTSVSFKCLSSPDAVRVLEQNYEYDLVGTESLLKRYIDKQVQINVRGAGSTGSRIIEGKLASSAGSTLIVERADGGMEIVYPGSIEGITLTEKPDDLVTRPTLVWLTASQVADRHTCEVTYTTSGIQWKADYLATLSDDEKTMQLSAWVTINNNSGTAYKDAGIKLIAGDVNRIQPPRYNNRKMRAVDAVMAMEESGVGGFQEESFMEYHLYTLGRKSTINNRQVKQIELFDPVANIPAEKRFIYETAAHPWMIPYNRRINNQEEKGKVQVKIEFENTEENGLGIALPKGKIRTFKANPNDKALEFVGEDLIDHTPKKEKLSLYIGNAFDVVVEDKIIDQKNRDNNWHKITRQVKIKNRKDEAVEVFIDELIPRYWNWTINKSTIQQEKLSAEKCRFTVPVKADSEVVLEYTYTMWK